MELEKVGAAVADDDNLAVEHTWPGIFKRAGKGREPLGPVQPVTGLNLLRPAVDMDLNPVAVVPDFMKSLAVLRRLGLQYCKLELNERRHLNTLWQYSTHKHEEVCSSCF